MPTLSQRFGPAVKALRKRRGLTQGALADRCSLSRSAIGQFERGLASPSLETLGRILESIGVDLRDLQDELDRQAGLPVDEVEDTPGRPLEIGGVLLSAEEVDRRINAAFDRLVRRSLEGDRKSESLAVGAKLEEVDAD